MKDEEIKKALECCNKPVRESKCTECAFNHTYKCTHNMLNATLDLINRQQAEIERLKEERILEEAEKALKERDCNG